MNLREGPECCFRPLKGCALQACPLMQGGARRKPEVLFEPKTDKVPRKECEPERRKPEEPPKSGRFWPQKREVDWWNPVPPHREWFPVIT